MLRVSKHLQIPDKELIWRFSPSGGPGGQHANKVNTRVELVFVFADSKVLTAVQLNKLTTKFGESITITVDQTRSQHRNRELAMQRMSERLAGAFRQPKSRRKTKPTKGSVQRKIKNKKRRSQKIADRKIFDH